jgi:hypothetical protein
MKFDRNPSYIIYNTAYRDDTVEPTLSKNQLKKCAKGLHTFKELPRVITGQSISTPIWRCGCGVLMHTRKRDPNLDKNDTDTKRT